MADYLEVWSPVGSELVVLESDVVTIGRRDDNTVVLSDDLVSRSHAVVERVGATWCIRDLGSTNGTFVDGIRIASERPLRPGTEVRVGSTRMIFRSSGQPRAQDDPMTAAPEPAPTITQRERDVLLALFGRQVPEAMMFEPASTREVAADLSVSEAAVKQHLLHLYDKFHLVGAERRTRARLANEALRRGVISLSELRNSART